MDLPHTEPARRPLTLWTRVVFFFAGVLLPLICFFFASFSFSGTWQSGNLEDIVCYLLSVPGVLPFYPILLYAIGCMMLVVIDERNARHFSVRLGIYTGVLPALQYVFVLTITITNHARFDVELLGIVAFVGFWAWGAGGLLWAAGRWLVPWILRRTPFALRRVLGSRALMIQWFAFVLVSLVAVVANVALFGEALGEFLGATFLLLIFGPLAAAPYWALAVYGILSLRIFTAMPRTGQFTLGQVVGAVTWMAAYLAAWRWGVRLALQQYAQLPTDPPGGCYVCSAAAHGHRRWVGAKRIRHADGTVYWVNDQMRYLKCAEIALRTTAPRLHHLVRRIYDVVGPWLAARMVHPLASDAVYAAFKPAEWLARGLLRIAVPQFDRVARRIYQP